MQEREETLCTGIFSRKVITHIVVLTAMTTKTCRTVGMTEGTQILGVALDVMTPQMIVLPRVSHVGKVIG